MNQKLLRKIGLDMAMTALLAVLMIYSLTGPFWHELLGLGMLGLIFIHLAVNGRWIAAMTRRLFASRFSLNTLRYLCGGLLFVLVPFTVLSGVLISRSLLPVVPAANEPLWIVLHHWAAYLSLIMVSVHIGLHWKMIMGFLAKRFPVRGFKKLRSAVCKLAAGVIMLYGIKASLQYDLPSLQSLQGQADANAAVSSDSADLTQNGVIYLSADSKDVPSLQSGYDAPADGETLREYLGRLVCTGCHRRCSLLSPQCSRGQSQAAQAQSSYEAWQNAQEQSGSQDDEARQEDGAALIPDGTHSAAESLNDGDESADLAQITPIMGMYIAGTYYLLEFVSSRKRKGRRE